jgi:biotin-(acetyl-CoA carboxylase) ligase
MRRDTVALTEEHERAAMNEELTLPPAFTARPLEPSADPLAEAEAVARREDATGGLFYSVRPDLLEAALVLGPDKALRSSLSVLYPLMLAFGDALGSALPPRVAVHYGWPDRILINGGLAGALRLVSPTSDADDTPDWLLAGLVLDIMGGAQADPGLEKDRTSLFGEGVMDVSPQPILEAFARYFLVWLDRWESRGLKALEAAWIGRAMGHEEADEFQGPTGTFQARVKSLARDGNLVLEVAGRRRVLDLMQLLEGRGWRAVKRL